MKRKNHAADIIIITFLGILAVISLFPFYQTLILSFSKLSDIGTQRIFLYPVSIDFSSYQYLFMEGKVIRGLLVTLFVTVFGTSLNMLVTTSGAYALSKKILPGRDFILNAIIFTMFFSGGLIPFFLTVQSIGLQNNLFVMIFPTVVNTFYLILLKNFFRSITPSLEESAKIDGANDIVILLNIVLPVSKPIIAAISLFYAVDRWNEWWMAMIFINNTKLYPLQLVLRQTIINIAAVMTSSSISAAMASIYESIYPESVKAAIIMLSTLPILCVYPFLQKHFSAGIMVGSIKE